MKACSACGRCRPDSQTDCDCGARPREWSVPAVISLLLSGAVELFILAVMSDLHKAELAAGAVFFAMACCVAVMSLVNLGLAAMSYHRSKGWAWLVAPAGVAVWFATIARMLNRP
jgi:hypothetical protein